MYHRKEKRIRAHVILCWLALLLIRSAEIRTGRSLRRLHTLRQRILLGSFVGPHGSLPQRSELSQEQKGLDAALGIAEPPVLETLEPQPAQPPATTPAASIHAWTAPVSSTLLYGMPFCANPCLSTAERGQWYTKE